MFKNLENALKNGLDRYSPFRVCSMALLGTMATVFVALTVL